MKVLFLAPLVLIVLAACGDKSPASVGVSVEKSATNSNDSSTVVGRDKKIDEADKAAISIKMAAPVLLAKAAKRICADAGISPPYRNKFLSVSDKTLAGKVSPKLANRTTIGAIEAIAATFEGAIGWPEGDENSFMVRTNAIVNFVDAISTEAVGKIGVAALQHPDAAQQAIIFNIAAIPPETLEAMWASSVKEAKQRGRPSANLAGSNTPIEYRIGDQVVAIGPQGMSLISNGTTMFGEGKIGGKAIDVSLETSLSTGLGRKLSLDSKAATGDSETTKVDAGVKH